MKKIVLFAAVAIVSASCVSTKTFNSAKADIMRLESELTTSNTRVDELNSRVVRLNAQIEALQADTARLNAEYTHLNDRYKQLLSDGSAEASRMLRQLEENQRLLDERSARVNELEQLLNSREQALAEIRRKVADALLGFEGNGLTISTRDGNVYVSMDDKLLFRSGSFDIEAKGAEAVRELATVLAQNPDINIMVEGHTDDVPYRGSGNLRDNLDLSAKRATTVVRLLLENKGIDPVRIIAAGRGEYLPLDAEKTPEARARNRRTEIILTPKLDELWRIMDK